MTNEVDLRDDLWGLEWDFVAVDTVGHAAILTSGGHGPIPLAVLTAREQVERAIAIVGTMPVTTTAVDAQPDRDGNYSDWYAYSARGLFTYDWHTHHGPYELISSPAEPLSISALPEAVLFVARLLTIPQPFTELTEFFLEYPR